MFRFPLFFPMILISILLLGFNWSEVHLMKFLTLWGGGIELTAISDSTEVPKLDKIGEIRSINKIPSDGGSSLPQLFSISLKASEYTIEEIEKIAGKIQRLGHFRELFFPIGWVSYHGQAIKITKKIVKFIYVSLIFFMLLIIISIFYLGFEKYRDEIFLRLVSGAARGGIFAPLVMEGFSVGIISSSIAVIFFYGVNYLIAFRYGFTFYLLGIEVPFSFISYADAIKIILCSGTLGAISALFVTKRLISRAL